MKKDPFYESYEWQRIRFQALLKHGNKCLSCNRDNRSGVVLHVDHIKPRSKYPELELDINNLQVLCGDCNLGKSNSYETDFRRPERQKKHFFVPFWQACEMQESANNFLRLSRNDDPRLKFGNSNIYMKVLGVVIAKMFIQKESQSCCLNCLERKTA